MRTGRIMLLHFGQNDGLHHLADFKSHRGSRFCTALPVAAWLTKSTASCTRPGQRRDNGNPVGSVLDDLPVIALGRDDLTQAVAVTNHPQARWQFCRTRYSRSFLDQVKAGRRAHCAQAAGRRRRSWICPTAPVALYKRSADFVQSPGLYSTFALGCDGYR